LCFANASAATLRGREARGAGSSGPSSSLEDKSDAISFNSLSFAVTCDPVVAIGLQSSVKPEEGYVAVADLPVTGSSFMKHEVGDSRFVAADLFEVRGKMLAEGSGVWPC